MESVFGSATIRSSGRHTLNIKYDPEMQMTAIAIGDEAMEILCWVPTHKLAGLLADAFAAASDDPHSIGYSTWKKGDVGHSMTRI